MNDSTILFIGPTISITEAKKYLANALYLPPVKCGDVIKCMMYKPKKIGIIDGCFENIGAVWHKEILFAIEHNIQVYGAASMGALRAAELADFGMIGIGQIFSDFYSGKLCDDDEVAELHRPGKSDYESITDSMVNIRGTLTKAVQENIINQTIADELICYIKSIFFKNRNLRLIVDDYCKNNKKLNLIPLKHWLNSGNKVNQKKIDAIELLKLLSIDEGNLNKNSGLILNNTVLLQKLNNRLQCESSDDAENTSLENEFPGITRYSRLMAYTIKSCDALIDYYKRKVNKLIFPISVDNIYPLILNTYENMVENPEFLKVFYSLIISFDENLANEIKLNWRCDDSDLREIKIIMASNLNNAIKIKFLLVISHIVYAIKELLEIEGISLNNNQTAIYQKEIMNRLNKTFQISNGDAQHNIFVQGNVNLIINTYFILKDILNNNVYSFFSHSNQTFLRPYYTLARTIYCHLAVG